MISETMPLNEWPLILLKGLEFDLELIYAHWNAQETKPVTGTLIILAAVKSAIKDAQEKENQLPFK